MQTWLVPVIFFLLNAALVGAGIYLSAYLKRKAESLATKEEFKDLQKQTAELTRGPRKWPSSIALSSPAPRRSTINRTPKFGRKPLRKRVTDTLTPPRHTTRRF